MGGEAASGSQAHRRRVQERDKAETARRWGLVCASARPGQTAEAKTINHLVPPGPQTSSQRPRVPREPARHRRKTLGTFHTCLCRRPSGEVPGVLSKRGRNRSPKPTKILGPTLAELTSSPVVGLSQKRWAIAILHWELQSGLGVGEPPVRGDTHRREQAVGIAVLASLFVRRVCHHEMSPGKPWSLLQLQHALRLPVMTNQVEHTGKVKMAKTRKAASSLALRLQGVNSELGKIEIHQPCINRSAISLGEHKPMVLIPWP